jgi:hypothetical protein
LEGIPKVQKEDRANRTLRKCSLLLAVPLVSYRPIYSFILFNNAVGKEEVVAKLKLLSQHYPGGTE